MQPGVSHWEIGAAGNIHEEQTYLCVFSTFVTARRTTVLGPPGWGGELECAKTRLGPTCSLLTRQLKSRPVTFSKDLGFENGNRGLKHRLGIACPIKVAWASGRTKRVSRKWDETEGQCADQKATAPGHSLRNPRGRAPSGVVHDATGFTLLVESSVCYPWCTAQGLCSPMIRAG